MDGCIHLFGCCSTAGGVCWTVVFFNDLLLPGAVLGRLCFFMIFYKSELWLWPTQGYKYTPRGGRRKKLDGSVLLAEQADLHILSQLFVSRAAEHIAFSHALSSFNKKFVGVICVASFLQPF